MKLAVDDIKTIAVFRALQLGDMLCVIPAMRSLRNAYPNAEITLLGLPWASSFVERFHKYFDKFIHFPGYPGLPEQSYNENNYLKFQQLIKDKHFDLLLQMQGNGTIVNPLLLSWGAKNVAGFYNDESYVDSDLFIPYPDFGSEISRHLMLMQHLGIPSSGNELEFPLQKKDSIEINNFSALLFPKRYIIVHPGSRATWRQWPPQFFAAVADYCVEQKFTVVITGTENESEITKELIKCMHCPAIDLTGKTSLGGVAALIEDAFMLVANCTGVSHIASALQTPSIIISMDGEPERWSPINRSIHKIIDCSTHPHFDEVYSAVAMFIKNNMPPSYPDSHTSSKIIS